MDIRQYQPDDRDAVLQIAADTAFFGEPVEKYLSDRRLFNDLMYAYYTDYEPEHLWVACPSGQVVGFLAGAFDTQRRERFLRQRIIPGWLGRLARNGYRLDRSSLEYARRMLVSALRGEIPAVDVDRYPAHLHINLSAASRGQGLGKALMSAYLDQLGAASIPGVHLHTTSLNQAAIGLYRRFGFVLLDARPTQAWVGLIDTPVENQAYGLKLEQNNY